MSLRNLNVTKTPKVLISKLSILLIKKIICGLPTLTAVPPECSLLSLSIILIFKFFVFNFSDKGISFHSVLALPISVVTMLFPKISDFKFPDIVFKTIFLLLRSFDIKSATHLVPLPQAPDSPPSEL